MTDTNALLFATTASLTALRTSISVSAHVLEALVKTGAIERRAALSVFSVIERDARSAGAGTAEIIPILDAHFRSARQYLQFAEPPG